jgi:signal transduction histidine kinase
MRFVSREKNYSVKAVVHSEDEIGSLAKGFNEMLEQIQARETKLQIEIHERKRAEEEVRKFNEALELKVREKTAQLVEAQKELVRSEKLSMLGLIAGGMGNELRNPLGVMNNAVFFLKSVMTDADETVKEYLDIIKQEIDNSEGIISGLLDFYRMQRPRLGPVPVHELIKQGLQRCNLPENVKLRSDIPDMSLIINIDRLQMARVLQNLITNAYQAMPEGGELRISARSVQKRGSAEAQELETSELPNFRTSSLDEDFVEISVTDTGEGIAPGDMEKLFQPLFSTKSRGIGLGLAYSRKLTEANGGRIEVESQFGKGTTFTVVLPAAGKV